MNDRTGPPRSLAGILEGLMKSWGLDRMSREREVFLQWDKALGPTLAGRLKPVAIHHGVLIVAVKDSAWLQELHFIKDDIKKKLNRFLGRGVIQDIRFKIGWWEESTPGAADAISEKAPPLPPQIQQEAEEAVQVIKDPVLRDQVLRTLLAIARRASGKE
jgi:hypothetical protein